MSRSRKVDPEVAIGAAMNSFWTHGFCALGTRQIEEETGITRFTLQTTYGGKMKLYLAALDTYLDVFENSQLFNPTEKGLEGIAVFFETRGNPDAMPAMACQGCFILNSIVEFAHHEPEINQRTNRYFAMLRQMFQSAFQHSKADGTLPEDFDILAMTEVLLGSALGLNAVIRSSADGAVGQAMANSIANMVRGWRK